MSQIQTPADDKASREITPDFVEKMRKMASGEMEPSSPAVAYLLGQYKETQAEVDAAQKQLVAAQEAILKLRGRLLGLEQDLIHFSSDTDG